MRFYIKTLGCKVNQSEGEELASELAKKGLIQVNETLQADLVIINTCTVTKTADSKARQMVGRAIKSAKGKVVITGCAVNNPHSGLDKFKDNALFVKQEEKLGLLNIGRGVARREGSRRRAGLIIGDRAPTGYRSDRTPRRSRPFIKIQDGCNHSCSYCIVPSVRGSSRSLDYQSIIGKAKSILEQGYKELVLTGVDIGTYEDNGRDLKGLISDLLALQADFFRIRLSSIEPQSLKGEFLSYFAGERRICGHIHLPLQSGSNRVLKMMNRPYGREYFQRLVDKIRKKRPDIALTTDIIVGFPQETEEDFKETMSLVEQIGFTRIHIFPYSSRLGVEAEKMPGQVRAEVKKERVAQLKNLAEELSDKFKKRQIGQEAEVLVERPEGKFFKGISSNYLTIYGNGLESGRTVSRIPAGKLVKVKITKFKDGRLFGKLANSD